MRRKRKTLFLLVQLTFMASWAGAQGNPVAAHSTSELILRMGLTEDGRPTSEWIDMVSVFNDEESLNAIALSRNSLSAGQRSWARLIEERARIWPARIQDLKIPFEDVTPPPVVSIVLGNVGGSDAFVREEKTIGFDLSRLYRLYDSAVETQNSDRIDRFFAHEYTHLLHKAWRKKRGLVLRSPFESALWICLTEGLGNYRSLSGKWTTSDGQLTTHAIGVLSRLQPVFVERLSALQHASEEEADLLMEGLSSGPFERKWGALTVALWLAQEARGDDRRLRYWVELGPWGVLDLARNYLPENLAKELPESSR